MVHFLELIYFLFLLKAILRCLYFWQIKEYRFDRFRTFLSSSNSRRFFLPTKSFLKPKLTLKVFILTYLSLYFSVLILRLNQQVIVPIAAYLFTPLTTTVAVIILMPLTTLVYTFIIFLAKLKLKLLHQHLTVIGITGSFGKTSTKEILTHLLSAKYLACKTPATKNTAIGVALTILKTLKTDHQYFVVEMGAYKKGEIKQICQLTKPQIGILTGITKQHLSLFGNLENLIQAKYELIKALPSNGLAIFNGHNPQSSRLAKLTKSVKTITYQFPEIKYQTNLIGDFQQLNIQAAITAAKHLNIPSKIIKNKLTTIPAFTTAVTAKTGLHQAKIINDSYNSNPEGFKALINHVKQIKAKTKILITPGIIELGKDSKAIHSKLIKLSEAVFDHVFITKPDLRYLVSTKTKLHSDYRQLLKELKPKLNSNCLILLEGRLPQKFIIRLCQNQS